MWILGLSGGHNGAVSLVHDGRPVFAVQAERIFRRKRYPLQVSPLASDAMACISYALKAAGISLSALEAIAITTPWSFARPWLGLKPGADPGKLQLPPILTVPHHLSHAEYAWHYGPKRDAVVLVVDGSGSRHEDAARFDIRDHGPRARYFLRGAAKESISAYRSSVTGLELIYRVALGELTPGAAGPAGPDGRGERWLESLGHLWEWAAWYCHGDRSAAGKVMGLAAYGDPARLAGAVSAELHEDGDFSLTLDRLAARFTAPNLARQDITGAPDFPDLAAHVQQVTDDIILRLARDLLRREGLEELCYTGGVALNCVTNEKLWKAIDGRLHMNGSCEDNGCAIGAALAAWAHLGQPRMQSEPQEYLGRSFEGTEVVAAFAEAGLTPSREADICSATVARLASGKAVGWMQGRSEFGPRALGNRSILCDPRSSMMKDKLNRTKGREMFRPFAPVTLLSESHGAFDFAGASPFMLRSVPVRTKRAPAACHVDGSARLQTVTAEENPRLAQLLQEFQRCTGCPILLNTSFNMSDEPIVESPSDAIRTFMRSDLQTLVIGDYLFERPPP
jgi:carbamoyltransferase